jgi:peptidoglycan/LPS O-acetylase OafA/YrhL
MRRIPSLDGLRAISITLVVLAHLIRWKHVSLARAETYAAVGVHIFFVLSGFLITNLLLREYERTSTISLREFYLRRTFRIFPAAYVFLTIVVILYWHEMRWYHIAAAFLYVANMDPTRPWIFGHLWSLGIEEQFYLLWPFVLKKWYRQRTTIVLCVFLATPVFRTIFYALKIRGGLGSSLPVVADRLAIGCLLAILAPRLPKISRRLALAMVFAIIFIPWFPAVTPLRTLFMLFVLRPLFDISIAGIVLHVIQFPYRALNWAPVVWLGKISYSLYLWQELFCSNRTLHYGYVLALPALACASLSYYFVEKPMLRLRERITRSMETRRRPPAPLPGAQLAPQ